MRTDQLLTLQGITIGILVIMLIQMLIQFRILQERVLLLHHRLDQQTVSASSASPFVLTPQFSLKRSL